MVLQLDGVLAAIHETVKKIGKDESSDAEPNSERVNDSSKKDYEVLKVL